MAISGGDGSITLTTKVDQTGFKKGLASMKQLTATANTAFVALTAAAGTATVAITKMAVSAYADYQQLVGGVETIFKGSAQKVLNYANDAFYTAGVSANEYMKQVTSFSASLISSTAGDTEKAADIANMAMIDMSDNANKMGSSMESVTLAYQGFARQQYMLLDNLKLGYGGTKGEMERLLRDAEAYLATQGQSAKFSIENLADVYTAINVIQQKLGIAGTTIKEAEQTITGSFNMMKASWKNVLSSLVSGINLDSAINNLVYSIGVYFQNIVPAIQKALVGIGKLIERVAPMLVQNVASALIQAIPSLVNAVYQMILGLAKGIWAGIKALFSGGTATIQKQVTSSGGSGGSISLGGGGGTSAPETPTTGGGSKAKGKSEEEKAIDNQIDAIQDKIKALQKENKQIRKNDKANQEANKKSLASFDELNALSLNETSESDKLIDKNENEIDQLQEQLDLLNDKKQAMQDIADINVGSSGGNINVPTTGNVGAVGGSIADLSMNIESSNFGENSAWLSEKIGELANAFSGLKDIDLTKLTNSLQGLKKPLQDLADMSWKSILWGIENVIVPLTKFNIEEVLPRFFDSLKISLEGCNTILTKTQPLFQTLWDEFLKPVAKYTGGKFLEFWDLLNEKLGEFVTMLQESEIWNDFQIILDKILPLLEPIAKGIINIITEIAKFKIEAKWIDFKWLLKDIEDAIGFIAALLQGDFSDAWEHLKDILFDNKFDKFAEYWDLLKDKFQPVIDKLGDLVVAFDEKTGGMITEWKTKISKWWNNDVKPWFTKKKWKEQFDTIVDRMKNMWDGSGEFRAKWKSKIKSWWNDDVAPWFTVEKWKTFFSNIVTALVNFFDNENGFLAKWNEKITGWWNDKVAPWFSWKQWWEVLQLPIKHIVEFFSGQNGFNNEWTSNFRKWWNEAIKPWFSFSKWWEIFQLLIKHVVELFSGQNGFNNEWTSNFRKWWNETIKPWFTFSKWWEVLFQVVKNVFAFFTGANGFNAEWKTNMSNWWNDHVVPWFSWNKWSGVFNTFKDVFKTGFKNALNGAIEFINKGIENINGMLEFSWDPIVIFGKKITKGGSVDLGSIPSIPALARGAVLPPNKPFLAMLGDQKNGTNVEAPLDTIKEALKEAMTERGNYAGRNQTVVLNIDGREMARFIANFNTKEEQRIGLRVGGI